MGDGQPDELRYTAFLSYSHKDAAAAGRLHRRLETYRMPRRLVGTETPRGPVPARLAPIFRDREELPAATDLSATVREALARSGALIVLCSPAAAGSLWVAEEIETFRRIHPDRPVLAAVLDGDPPDCFPQALRAFGRDGTWHEPLATDLRKHRDGRRLGLLKLVAGITGIGLDALVQRDAARKIRRVMAVTGVALVAMLAMATLALIAINARGDAERQRAEAERQRTQAEGLVEFMLTDLRERLRGVGRLDIMGAVNQRALQYYRERDMENDSRTVSPVRARVLHAIGEVQMDQGNKPAALATFAEAHRITTSLMERAPSVPANIFAHAQSEYWLGYHAYMLNNLALARTRFGHYRRLAGQLRSIDSNNVDWLREAAYAASLLCALDQAQATPPRVSLRSCSSALTLMKQVWEARRNDPVAIRDLANSHGWMVDIWSANGRWDLALQNRARHEALVAELLRRDPSNLDYQDIQMRSHFGYGELLARRGLRAAAQREFDKAARTANILAARDPVNATWRNWQARIATKMHNGGHHAR